MDRPNSPEPLDEQAVLQLASAYLGNPREDAEVLTWLLSLTLPDPRRRRAAVLEWPQKQYARIRVPLLVALHDPDEGVRDAALRRLTDFSDVGNVEALVAAFPRAGGSGRCWVAFALARLRNPRPVEPMLTLFQEDLARRQQQAKGRPIFFDLALETIVGALGASGDARTVAPLIAALSCVHWHCQNQIANALVWLKDRRAADPLLAALTASLARARKVVKEGAGGRQQASQLPLLPVDLVAAVAEFGDVRAVKPLLALLANTSLSVWDRVAVVKALGQLGDRRAVAPLCKVMGEKSVVLRTATARTLGLFADARAVAVLISALSGRSGHLRAAAARSLGQIGDVRAIEPLLELLPDRRVLVHRSALWALCRVGDVRAVLPLIDFLRQGSGSERRAAATALGRIGDERAAEPLTSALQDQDRLVQGAAREALGRLHATAVIGDSPLRRDAAR